VTSSSTPLIPHRRRTPSVLNPTHPLGLRRKATSTRGRLVGFGSASPSSSHRFVIAVLPSRSSRSVTVGGRSSLLGTWSTPRLPLNRWSVTIPAVRVYKSLLPYFYFSWLRRFPPRRHRCFHVRPILQCPLHDFQIQPADAAVEGTGSVTFSYFRSPCSTTFGTFPSFSSHFCYTLLDPLH